MLKLNLTYHHDRQRRLRLWAQAEALLFWLTVAGITFFLIYKA